MTHRTLSALLIAAIAVTGGALFSEVYASERSYSNTSVASTAITAPDDAEDAEWDVIDISTCCICFKDLETNPSDSIKLHHDAVERALQGARDDRIIPTSYVHTECFMNKLMERAYSTYEISKFPAFSCPHCEKPLSTLAPRLEEKAFRFLLALHTGIRAQPSSSWRLDYAFFLLECAAAKRKPGAEDAKTAWILADSLRKVYETIADVYDAQAVGVGQDTDRELWIEFLQRSFHGIHNAWRGIRNRIERLMPAHASDEEASYKNAVCQDRIIQYLLRIVLLLHVAIISYAANAYEEKAPHEADKVIFYRITNCSEKSRNVYDYSTLFPGEWKPLAAFCDGLENLRTKLETEELARQTSEEILISFSLLAPRILV